MGHADDGGGLDVSNDPEVERLGANASVQHAMKFWELLCVAARLDGRLFDPLWADTNEPIFDTMERSSHGATTGNSCQHTKELIFTDSATKDNRLYHRFRSNLGPYWNVQAIAMGQISTDAATEADDDDDTTLVASHTAAGLNPLTGERWTSLLLVCEGVVADYNFMTLLRADCLEPFWMTESVSCDGLLVVPRAQFVCIELARSREGYYADAFRRQLEIFDIKTVCDDLQSAVETILLQSSTQNQEMVAAIDTAAADDKVRTALSNLSTQWPHPTVRTLKVTRAVSTLKRVLQTLPCTSWIHSACLEQLHRWRDVIQLGKLSSQLVDSAASSQTSSNDSVDYAQLLKRATRALLQSSSVPNANRGTTEPHGKAQESIYRYVTKTTENLSELTVAKPKPASGNLYTQNAESDSKASTVFDDYGLVLLPNFCCASEVAACRHQGEIALRRLQDEQLTPRGLKVDGDETFDFVEVRQRPGHRVDNRYSILDDPASPIANLGRKLLKHLSSLNVGSDDMTDWRLLYAGIVHAFPGTLDSPPPPQLWHRDGPSLFTGRSHHSTHCLNVFVPLIDINAENGATEFVPGTHEDARYDAVSADVVLGLRSNGEARIVRADCTAGSAIVFDIRVMHRGLSNRSSADRPLLYYTFCRDWFQEQHMFQKAESLIRNPLGSHDAGMSKLCHELYYAITGTAPQVSTITQSFGHPHYTTRFDLLLLEQFLLAKSILPTENTNALAASNERHNRAFYLAAAVLRFANATTEVKEAICKEFVEALGSKQALIAKRSILEACREARNKQANKESDIDKDFSSIQADMSDVIALYRLTAQRLFDEPTHLSALGFPLDEAGVTIALATIKSYVTTFTSCSVSAAQVEECFSLWWNGASSRSRFEYMDSNRCTDEHAKGSKSLLVVFSSLGSGIARPEWHGTLNSVGVKSMANLDVLHVMDFSYSWYCQDPTGQWNGSQYYSDELKRHTKGYLSVMFVGDSMGAAAALLFSTLANRVLAFTPQVDISSYEAVTRADFTAKRRLQLKEDIVTSVKMSQANITVHYGGQCEEDVRHVQLLPISDHVSLVEHVYDDHILTLHLRDKGELTSIVSSALREFSDILFS